MRRLLTALLLACLLAPAAARADGGVNKLLIDACRDEHVDGHYTQRQFKTALEQLPTDSDEYTACRQVIESARLAALSGGGSGGGRHGGGSSTGGGGATTGTGGGGSSNGSAPGATPDRSNPLAGASPAERKAIERATKAGQPVNVGGKIVRPGALNLGGLAGSEHGLPTTLVALIALLGLSAAGGASWWLWTRVLAGRFR